MQKGKVSVIIPSYNYAHYLETCVKSVLTQTYQDWEAIIVDDGSTDQTSQVASELVKLAPDKIKYLRISNSGVSQARNIGIDHTNGEYILPLDADDLLEPIAIEEFVRALNNNLDCGYAYSALENYDSLPGENKYWYPGPFNLRKLLIENSAAATSMWRRELTSQGIKYRKLIYEDWDLWLQIVSLGKKGCYVPKPLFKYRLHASGRTSRNKFLYLPAFLQELSLHPSLYNTQLSNWAEHCLAFSPDCWNSLTVAILPVQESSSFNSFDQRLSELCQPFLDKRIPIFIFGNYPLPTFGPKGVTLVQISNSFNNDSILHNLRNIGENVLVLSELPEWVNKRIESLQNVNGLLALSSQVTKLPEMSQPIDLCVKRHAERKEKEAEAWRQIKSISCSHSRNKIDPEFIKSNLTLIQVIQGENPQSITRSLQSLTSISPEVKIILVDLSPPKWNALYQNIALSLKTEYVAAPNGSASQGLNQIISQIASKWVMISKTTPIYSESFFDQWIQLTQYFSLAATYQIRVPHLSLHSNEIVHENEVKPSLFILPTNLIHQLSGFNPYYTGSSFEIDEFLRSAEYAGTRLIEMASDTIHASWGVQRSWQRYNPGNLQIFESFKNAPASFPRHQSASSASSFDTTELLESSFNFESLLLRATTPQAKVALILQYAHLILKNGLLDPVVSLCFDALNLEPQNTTAMLLLAAAYEQQGLNQLSAHWVEVIRTIEPHNSIFKNQPELTP